MSTPEQAPPSQPLPEALDDADDLRGHHFKLLLGRGLTWVLIGALVVVVGVALAVLVGPAIGAAGAAGALLLGIVGVFVLADSRAADDFFTAYAQQRGMTLISERGKLPPRTPLLEKGDERYTERSLLGPLGAAGAGTLALYTYEEESRDSKGNKQTSYYRYTLGLLEVPECRDLVPELYCQRKFGLRALQGLEDVFRGKKERVELESEALADRYEIFAAEGQDPNWLRQLFAPTFIVWLTDAAPEKFAFELVEGTLCCYVSGHKENAAELDAVAAATAAVATRLREESLE